MSKKISQLTTNATPLESDLSVVVNSGETKKLTLGAALVVPHPNNLVFEDITFPAEPDTGTDAPDFDYTEVGWLFDPGTNETIVAIAKMPHSWAEGTDVLPHVHWVQSASGTVLWQLEYRWTNRGELQPGSFTTITASTPEYTWTSGDLHQITKFASIPGTGKTINSILQMRLTRLADDGSDNYAQDALTTEFNLHIQMDGIGTRQEYIK